MTVITNFHFKIVITSGLEMKKKSLHLVHWITNFQPPNKKAKIKNNKYN